MIKDFQKWHANKININDKEHRVFFHEREVWWCALGLNVGYEMDGKGNDFLRPIIVVKKFNEETFWGLPVTSQCKTGRYYFRFSYKDNKNTTANLSQLRLFDSKRLKYQVGQISDNDFTFLKEKLKQLIT